MKLKSNPSLTLLTIIFGLLFLNYFLENKIVFYFSLLLSGIGVFSVKVSKLIEKIWFKIAYILSQLVPNILLSLIFYFVLTPLAILSKLFNSKTEYLSINNQDTAFKSQNKVFDKKSFERAW